MARSIVLFLLICGFNGVFVFFGSILGNAFGKTGLFGIVGISAVGAKMLDLKNRN